jgi:flagellin-like hook-associated protein FlgL
MAWNKLKSMFVVSDQPQAQAPSDPDQVIADLDKYQLPEGGAAPLPDGTSPAALSGQIDFQSLYDQAGIPNTDEVEAVERFLNGLDASLPDGSKLAASKAFLSAIGKSVGDVVKDAGRKITVVRAVADAKRADTEKAAGQYQGAIAALQKQIDDHRASMEAMQRDLESVRSQCTVEESRLQGARMFFGHVTDAPDPPPAPAARRR